MVTNFVTTFFYLPTLYILYPSLFSNAIIHLSTQMFNKPSILTITGSDSTGGAGVQADIKTITAMGVNAFAVITSVTVQDSSGISCIYDLPEKLVVGQAKIVIEDIRLKAVKVGMVRDIDTIVALSREVVALRNIVLAPGIVSSSGVRLLSDNALRMWEHHLLPLAKLLVLRCDEAEVLLGISITTNMEMEKAAKMLVRKGADAVLLRMSHHVEGMLTSMLYENGTARFFSTQNVEGWQRHGISGAMSTAIAVRLAMGDSTATAVSLAHEYMHSQVVYSIKPSQSLMPSKAYRPADLYNQFMSLIADHHREAHDVTFYADRMAITPRYLYDVTDKAVGKSPKLVISEYVVQEARKMLETSRMTVQEISVSLGFSSQAMFCRFFAQHTGKSPSEYRKQAL